MEKSTQQLYEESLLKLSNFLYGESMIKIQSDILKNQIKTLELLEKCR